MHKSEMQDGNESQLDWSCGLSSIGTGSSKFCAMSLVAGRVRSNYDPPHGEPLRAMMREGKIQA
jgi:hypothetical protein